MASAAAGDTLTTVEDVIFDYELDGGKCTTFMIANRVGSSNNVLVRIPGLHEEGEYVGIAPGVKEYFRLNTNGIEYVYAKTDSGSATVDYGVSARNSTRF